MDGIPAIPLKRPFLCQFLGAHIYGVVHQNLLRGRELEVGVAAVTIHRNRVGTALTLGTQRGRRLRRDVDVDRMVTIDLSELELVRS